MTLRLQDKVAIITGAGTGIGRAIAVAYAVEGAHIIGAARRVEKLQETAKEVEEQNRKFLAVPCDVTKKEDCFNVARQAMATFGKIDILVNNAAIYPVTPFLQITEEEWDAVLNTNLRGYFFMCQAVIPYMVAQKNGSVIMVNSNQIRSQPPSIAQDHYVAAKGGVETLTKCLASEFGPVGIRVNGFCPTLTPEAEQAANVVAKLPKSRLELVSNSTPLRRFGRLDDYKGIAVLLASDEGDYITGQTIAVDGGFTMR